MKTWKNSKDFYIYFEALRLPQLEHIVHFRVDCGWYEMMLLDKRGGWKLEAKGTGASSYVRTWYVGGTMESELLDTESELEAAYDIAVSAVSLQKQLLDHFGLKP